jgi:hypothetical protein
LFRDDAETERRKRAAEVLTLDHRRSEIPRALGR